MIRLATSEILIDTNRYSDFDAGVPEVVERYERADQIWLPLIVLAELRSGFALGKHESENQSNLSAFLKYENVDVLSPTEETTQFYARVFAQLRRAGTPIPTNDIWIAALAIQHDLQLDTRDAHFQKVEGIKLV